MTAVPDEPIPTTYENTRQGYRFQWRWRHCFIGIKDKDGAWLEAEIPREDDTLKMAAIRQYKEVQDAMMMLEVAFAYSIQDISQKEREEEMRRILHRHDDRVEARSLQ